MENSYCVYYHKSPSNKYYIGITKNKPEQRWQNGLGYRRNQTAFWNAIKKYGWDNFEHKILENNLTQQEAKQKEIYYIEIYNTLNDGYNISKGGDLGRVGCINSKETRKKISDKLKERWKNETYRKNFCEHLSEIFKKENNPFFGKKHTEETKRILSEKAKQRKDHKRGVYQMDDNNNILNSFESIKDASDFVGVKAVHIFRCCNGVRKHTGGFKWAYIKGGEK